MPKTTIVIVDDHQVVRHGLRALLEMAPEFTVVGEAGTGPEAVSVVECLRPTVLLLDLMLPGLNGLEVLRQVRQRTPATHVLILSLYAEESQVREALRTGATGYCLKTAGAAEVLTAVGPWRRDGAT